MGFRDEVKEIFSVAPGVLTLMPGVLHPLDTPSLGPEKRDIEVCPLPD